MRAPFHGGPDSRRRPPDVEERMKREMRFDPDLWLVEVDDAKGRHFLDLAPARRSRRQPAAPRLRDRPARS